jgi:tetratricopeptide (TPR) repeat protein
VTQADLKANQVVSQQDRIQLTKTIEDVISTASFFDDSYVPVELLAKLADPAMLSEALSALVACMSFDPTYSPSYVKLNTNLRQRMQSQLLVSLSGQVYLNHALDALCSRFPTTFTHQRTMRIGQELHLHVLSTVSAASGYSLERDIFLRVASLTFHVCRYLLAAGRYTVISGLLSTFRQRFLPELRADLDLDTRLRGKECVTMKLQGNVSDALRISRDIYHLRREAFGMMNERTIHSLNNKGLLYHATGDYASANRCLSEALDLHAEMQGNDHPDTLITANNLGIILQSQGRYNDANLLFSRSLVGMTYACGKDCLDVLAARSNLGTSMHHQKRYHEARSHHQYVYERRCDILGPESHETVKSKANLAITINELGDHEKAEKMCREAARSLETELGHSHPDALKTHINLAAILFDRGNYTEAEDTIRTTLPMMDEKYGPTHPRTLRALEFRAILLHHMGSLSAAFAIMTQLVQVQRERTSYAPPDPDLQRNLDHVKELEADIERSHSL